MATLYKAAQTTGYNFRAQLLRTGAKWTLWIAESEDEVYVVNFHQILSADLYAPKVNHEDEKVILLYRGEEGIETVEIGCFSHEDALNFLSWLQTSVSNIGAAQRP
jgi:hypothetical protein